MMTQESVNDLAYDIVGAAMEVHREMGPGLLESIYEECLAHELRLQRINFVRQASIPLNYKGLVFSKQFFVDILVEDTIIVELKAVEYVLEVHKAQLLIYMKLMQKPKGLLINFNAPTIKSDLIPMVNSVFSDLPKK